MYCHFEGDFFVRCMEDEDNHCFIVVANIILVLSLESYQIKYHHSKKIKNISYVNLYKADL